MNLAPYIDHTLLKPDATKEEIRTVCEEAAEYAFFSVCIPPCYVQFASRILKGTSVTICTVAGFPAGYDHPDTKELSLRNSISHGAREIDVVINVAAVKSANWEMVSDEIRQVGNICRLSDVVFKSIFEVSLLTHNELVQLCSIVNTEGADFAKTSTGVYGSGATTTDVMSMRKLLDREIQIKASGGIRSRHAAIQLIRAGADRLGTSSSIDIIRNVDEP